MYIHAPIPVVEGEEQTMKAVMRRAQSERVDNHSSDQDLTGRVDVDDHVIEPEWQVAHAEPRRDLPQRAVGALRMHSPGLKDSRRCARE
eukprot:3487311-Prymnesium_polylepis.1